jgi:hypothetical protein
MLCGLSRCPLPEIANGKRLGSTLTPAAGSIPRRGDGREAAIGGHSTDTIHASPRGGDITWMYPVETYSMRLGIEGDWRGHKLPSLRAPVGIYLVGWFDKDKWDTDDGRRAGCRCRDWCPR